MPLLIRVLTVFSKEICTKSISNLMPNIIFEYQETGLLISIILNFIYYPIIIYSLTLNKVKAPICYINQMADELQLLGQLLCKNEETKKACALGIVVDCTAVYKVDENKDYIRRLKIVDKSLNQSNPINGVSYCTVMFFGKTPDELPAPSKIGQLIYLRRYDFNIWNNKFQAKKTAGNISSWVLFENDYTDTRDYIKSSRDDFALHSQKYIHLISPIHELRLFAREYFQKQSVAFQSEDSNDSDLILRVKEAVNQDYTFTNGVHDYTVVLEDQKPLIGSVVRLRSIYKVEGSKLVKNPYTWALEVEPWMRSYNELFFQGKSKHEAEGFVTIKDLLKDKNKYDKNQQFKVKCEVVDIEPKGFKKAVKYFNLNKNTISDNLPKQKDVEPVYSVKLLLRDKSGNANQQLQVVLFSWDGKGNDFVPQVDLNHLQFSSLVAESELYEQRVNELIEQTSLQKPAIATLQYSPISNKQSVFRLLKIV